MTHQPSDLPVTIARAPSLGERLGDRAFRGLTLACALGVLLLLVGLVVVIGRQAQPAIERFGVAQLTSDTWSTNQDVYGLRPQIWGTLYSSVLAMLLASVLGVSAAILLAEHFLPAPIERLIKTTVELLAAIPSVVYGLWGFTVLIPLLDGPASWLHRNGASIPLFSTPPQGPGMLPAVLVLTIMVLPTITAIARDALAAVPERLREASLGLGATRWQTIRKVVLPTALTGIFGAIVLAFGRALGETMAVVILIGNKSTVTLSILSPATTLASFMATDFKEADSPLHIASIMVAALVLLLITLLVNIVGSLLVWRASRNLRGL
jgi:phosphate transport system permease protein